MLVMDHISKWLPDLIEALRIKNHPGGMHGVANTVHKTGEDGLAVDSAGDQNHEGSLKVAQTSISKPMEPMR